MRKILVEVSCPATSSKYDFWISKHMRIDKLKSKLISQIVSFERNRDLFSDEDRVFLVHDSQSILNEPNLTVTQANIKSGDRLYII